MANNFANSINSSIGASNSGATNTFTVTNPSNTASSQALVNVSVGGGTAGDAFTTYTVSGATDWSTGVDNSASDAFVIAASTALGTTNVMSMATGGAVSAVLGNFDTTRSASGADVSITTSNTSNTASSTASYYATVAGGTAGDAQTQYSVSGTTTWTQGIDNSDSDAFVIAASTALGTTNVVHGSTAGEINYPLQPAFLAWLATNDTNATGAGALYTLGGGNALTEVFDQNSDFNTNGTFTSPVTGRYYLSCGIQFLSITAAMTFGLLQIGTSNRFYQMLQINAAASRTLSVADALNFAGSVLADMDAGDTATVTAQLSTGAGNTVTIGGTNTFSRFSGFLAC
jgi:hypothetical protein